MPTSTAPLPPDAAASHALLARATLAGLRRPAVVSHQSAAVLLGLPSGSVWPTRCAPHAAAGHRGEFDGRVTYGRFLRPGEEAGDAVFREKEQEDAIRDEGWGVVRWTWADPRQPHLVAARVRRRMR